MWLEAALVSNASAFPLHCCCCAEAVVVPAAGEYTTLPMVEGNADDAGADAGATPTPSASRPTIRRTSTPLTSGFELTYLGGS